MKRLLSQIILSFFSIVVTHAQVGVGPNEYFVNDKVDDFDETLLAKLKSSKTVFLYGEKDDPVALEATLRSVWTLTEIDVLTHEKFDSINFESTSVFSIEETQDNDESVCLQLWMQITNKKGKTKKVSFCQIRLNPNNPLSLSEDLSRIRNNLKSKRADSFYDYFYSVNRFKNLSNGFLKNYLKNVNELLKRDATLSPFIKIKENPEITNLKKKPVYIPEYALKMYSHITATYKNQSDEDVQKLFDDYEFPYEIVNNDTLNQKILNVSEDFYYMVFIQSSSSKQISIFNSATGNVVYNIYDQASFNFDSSDLKKLSKSINAIK